MRVLILPLLLGSAYLSGVEQAPKVGDDPKLDAIIAARYDAQHQPLVYQALTDAYGVSEHDGQFLRAEILLPKKRYDEVDLKRDLSVLGLRGKAREDALTKYDADILAGLDAEIAKIDAENAKLDLELKAQEEERAKQKKQGEQSKSPKP